MKRSIIFLLVLTAFAEPAGKPPLAPTPPMGWNSWEAFRKNFDENAIQAQADAMVALGLRDAGYRYIVLDGGWKTTERNAAGDLVVDPQKFPHGMKALADYIHSRGMKLGLHQPAGIRDCGEDEPGSQGHEERDAALFASWGVDLIKYDQCDYIHDPSRTPGAPDLDSIDIRQDNRVVFSAGAKGVGIGIDLSAVEVHARVPESGPHTLEIHFTYPYYGQNRDRFKQMTLFVSVNGGERRRIDIPYQIAQRNTTGSGSTSIELKQGDNLIRFDNPLSQEEDVRQSYLKMGRALQQTGRDFMFSTSGAPRPWLWAKPVAQMWRLAGDISNRWLNIMAILDRAGDVARFAGPNFWADPDMLEVGAPPPQPRKGQESDPMNITEQRSQFALWAVLGAPLMISADLRQISPEAKAILLNREVIAVDQDPLAVPGRRIRDDGDVQVFAKRLKEGEAVVLLNRGSRATTVQVTASELGLPKSSWEVRDLWSGQSERIAGGTFSAAVDSHAVKMFRISQSGQP